MSKIGRCCVVCSLLSVLCFGQSPSSTPPSANSAPNSPESGFVPANSAEHNTESNSKTRSLIPNSPSLLSVALQCYRKRDFAGAIASYERLLSEHSSPDAYAGLIRSYLKEKDVQKAADMAEQGIAKANSPRVRAARAEVWFRQGRITDAEREWVAIINSGYPEARAYLGLAQIRTSIAMYKAAKTMIDKARELDSQDPDIREAWVGTLSRAERIKYLEETLAADDNWSPGEREDTQNYLDYLKTREKDKSKPCELVSNVKATETPLVRLLIDSSHLRGYGLPVVLNGRKSSLMLDTGAGGITIKRSIAEKAGISKISATKIWGIGDHGKRSAFTGVAESIKIGELEFKNCPVEVMESRSVAGEDGLIGADVFENFLVELNFPDEKLKLSQLPQRPGEAEQKLSLKGEDDGSDEDTAEASAAGSGKGASGKTAAISKSGPQDRYIAPEMQSYTRVFRFDQDLLVPTSIGQTSPKLFLVDSGALTNFISPEAAREVTKVHGESDIMVEGLSGKVDKVFSANKATLVFGHLKQENQEMTAFDTKPLSDAEGTEISGFLGFTTLRFLDIKIDYRDALVDFEYDRSRRFR